MTMGGIINPDGGGMMSCGGMPVWRIRMIDGSVKVTVEPPAAPVDLAVRIASPRISMVTSLGVPLKRVMGAAVSCVSVTRPKVPSPLGTGCVDDRAVAAKRFAGRGAAVGVAAFG